MPLFDVGSNLVADLETATVVENHLPAWLQAVVTTAPLYASDSSDQVLDRFTPLQSLGSVTQDRMQVRVYRSDFLGVVDQGWIDLSQVGPALPPQVRVPSPTDRSVALRNVNGNNQQQAFLDVTAQAARDAAA